MDRRDGGSKSYQKIPDVKPVDMDEVFFKNTEKIFGQKGPAKSGLLKIYRDNQIQLFLDDL